MSQPLLVDFDGAAELLGVSARTVKRLVADGELPRRRMRRRVLIAVADLHQYVESIKEPAHNPICIESAGRKGNNPCHTDAKARLTGGSNTPMQAANQLTDLLKQLTSKKPKHSKQNGDTKSTSCGNGA
ncbi:MAG: helix-turn-helix domain-containing protein [Rhodocyclaceae bacterium]|nr:helix-turn-helix domain-containing protein [Rhodocyclaceae bacterium]